MKKEIAIIIVLIIGTLIGILIPQVNIILHILCGLYISAFIFWILIVLCFINTKINKWFY